MKGYMRRLLAIAACLSLSVLAALPASGDVFEFLDALDARIGNSPKEEYVLTSLMFFPAFSGCAVNEKVQKERVREISSSVYSGIFMKTPIYPFISQCELEEKFMEFQDKIGGGIAVAVFNSRNQPPGIMKKGNRYSMIRMFGLQNAEPIGWFYIPTQSRAPSWKPDENGPARPFASGIKTLEALCGFLSKSFNPTSEYFNFSNAARWGVWRSGNLMVFRFENVDAKGGFYIRIDGDSRKLCEVFPIPKG